MKTEETTTEVKDLIGGPWVTHQEGRCKCGTIWSVKHDIIIGGLHDVGDSNGDYYTPEPGSDEWAAKYCLVAAAPSMLETLEEELAYWISERIHASSLDQLPDIDKRIQNIQGAINTANLWAMGAITPWWKDKEWPARQKTKS